MANLAQSLHPPPALRRKDWNELFEVRLNASDAYFLAYDAFFNLYDTMRIDLRDCERPFSLSV